MATMASHNTAQDSPTDHRGTITYASRRNKRLRVCIRSNAGGETYSRVMALAETTARDPITVDIGRAQTEMFDDEVFEAVSALPRPVYRVEIHPLGQIRVEARNSPTLNARSSLDQISVDAVPGQELVFEMASSLLPLADASRVSPSRRWIRKTC